MAWLHSVQTKHKWTGFVINRNSEHTAFDGTAFDGTAKIFHLHLRSEQVTTVTIITAQCLDTETELCVANSAGFAILPTVALIFLYKCKTTAIQHSTHPQFTSSFSRFSLRNIQDNKGEVLASCANNSMYFIELFNHSV